MSFRTDGNSTLSLITRYTSPNINYLNETHHDLNVKFTIEP